MTKTLPTIQSTDTFQVWLQRTNDLVNELSTSIVTASVSGDVTIGNASLIGLFTANTIAVDNLLRVDAINNRSGNATPIDIAAPVSLSSVVQTPLTISTSAGPRIRFKNDNVSWLVGINGSTGTGTGAQFIVGVEGSSFQVRVGTDGALYANTILLDNESTNIASSVRSSRTISTSSGIAGGGNLTANRTFSLTGNALSLHNMSANGIVTKTAAGTLVPRTMTQGNGINIANGNGVAGNPTFSIDTGVVATINTTQTITGTKTFAATTFNGNITANANTAVAPGSYVSFNDKLKFTSNTTHGIILSTNDIYVDMQTANTSVVVRNSVGINTFTMNASTGNFTAAGDITAFSDERLKNDVRTIDGALSKLTRMRGVYFEKNGKRGTGVIAQEIESVLPEVVFDGGDYKSVAYGNMVGILIESIKELKTQLDEMAARIK